MRFLENCISGLIGISHLIARVQRQLSPQKGDSVALCDDKGYTLGCCQDMGNHAEAATWSGQAGPCKTTQGGITPKPLPHMPHLGLFEVL